MTVPLMTHLATNRNSQRQAQQSFRQTAARMIVKRSLAAAAVLSIGAMLGSCAGATSEDGFSAYVADHWPHWAGGMPSDVPPRPGSPGYNQFIAHGQADQDVLPPASGGNAPAVPVTPVFQTAPSSPPAPAEQAKPAPVASAEQVKPAQAAPIAASPPASAADDSSVVRGGLY
jgi:hypothetical protein